MGFQLGRALGKVASGFIRTATKGVIRPSFQAPASRTITKFGPGGLFGSTDQTRFFPGQQPSSGGGGTGTAMVKAPGTACAAVWDGTRFRATHLNKATYVTRGGGTSRWPKSILVHEKGTECVPRRRLNPGNGRAALRAVRRLTAFYSLSQRVAKQLRRAASKAHIGGRRGRRQLPAGRNVEVVNVE